MNRREPAERAISHVLYLIDTKGSHPPWGQDRPEAGSGQRAIALAIGIVASGVLILALICHLDCLLVAAVDCRVRSTESYQPEIH